jgi:hypothetical protein
MAQIGVVFAVRRKPRDQRQRPAALIVRDGLGRERRRDGQLKEDASDGKTRPPVKTWKQARHRVRRLGFNPCDADDMSLSGRRCQT